MNQEARVPQTPSSTMTITVGPTVTDGDIDEIVSALDEADLDAIVAPFPQRMGLPVEPLALAIEVPLGVLGTMLLQATGRRLHNAIARVARRKSGGGDTDRVVMTIDDPKRKVRIDATSAAMTDDRFWDAVAQQANIPDTGPVTLRWDSSSASLRPEPTPNQ